MKPTLQLKTSQQLNLTPQLQQSIRLLQLSTLELNQEIERIIRENPLLEVRESWDSESSELQESENNSDQEDGSHPDIEEDEKITLQTDQDQSIDWFESGRSSRSEQNETYEMPQLAADSLSLREHLNQQVSLSHVSDREKKIISLLIDSLDDDGYLREEYEDEDKGKKGKKKKREVNFEELIKFLPAELSITTEDLNQALAYLQHLDPPGVGARNLQECLLLQLKSLPDDTPHRNQAIKIVTQFLDELAAHDFALIKRVLKCDDQTLRAVQKLITNLNPKPGSDFNSANTRYIIPDIIVKKINGAWVANLIMSVTPQLHINPRYANILKQKHGKSSQSLSNELNEAKWLIKNIQQRSNTILKVANAIVERQQQFFEHGEIAMRPLILREIAETLGLHESTVSRVTTQKYMHTPRGIFELKYFFGSHVATDIGGACSATAIRALIKQLIQTENTKKPLSDNKIASLLGEQGIVVARRTVAKYREAMQIPPANLRKTF